MTIQLVREVAARAPISPSVAGSWACHAASRRPSALGDPVNTPSSPVRASRRALETWQDARTRAAAAVSAALRRTTAASSSRRFSVLRSRGQGGRLFERPRRGAQVTGGHGGQGGRFELTRQRLVRTQRRRGPVGQLRATGDGLGCSSVQFSPARRTEIGVDRGPVQRMGKGQLRRRSAFGQQSGGDRRIHLAARVGQPGHRRDRRHRRVLPKHAKLPPGMTEPRPGARPPGRGSPRTAPVAPAARDRSPRSARRCRSRRAGPGSTARCLRCGPPAETPRARTAPPAPARSASSVSSPALSPPSRIRVTRESPPKNRAQPGSASPPTRVDTTASTLSARSRRKANSTARDDGRSAHCRSSMASTTT